MALLRWGITVGSLALLLRVVNPRAIGSALWAADGRLLALAVLVALLHFGVAAWR